jgi:hypothetical protein
VATTAKLSPASPSGNGSEAARRNDIGIRHDAIVGLVLLVLVVLAAALVAALAVAVRNQRVGVTRRTHDPAIDPFTVGEPWRRLVQNALRSQSRYRESLALMRPGPMRDRLTDIGTQLDEAVSECWRIARRGDELAAVLDDMNIASARQQLAAIGSGDDERAEALKSRVASYDRIAATGADTEHQLRVLVARLDEMAARSAELSLSAGEGLAALGSDVTRVVDELEALRVAFDEIGPGGQ